MAFLSTDSQPSIL